ncbi:hypothetical protein FJK98_04475 [Micromonospora sp. HM134]|nr:hypothetical protein [Micromonospora sp. HM134]QDY06517.1 hypothetical protein FJK98_04475 [Micromonospora sp. HM134]
MIERGSGRTSGLTDWQLMDVLSMWACLQDQETPGHWKHVAGWRKVCELAQNHLRQLRQYRAGLAEAWPPATNAAARTYLGELDELISKVQRTHDTAAANHDALAAVTRAIDSTRPELKRIRDDYAEKLARKRGYEATLADPKAAAGSRVVDPPVTDADLERLNVQARGLMFGLSSELQQAQAMLQKPPPRPTPGRQNENSDVYAGSSAPVIPPIMPVPITATRSNASATGPSKADRTPSQTGKSMGPILGAAGSINPITPPHTGGIGVTLPSASSAPGYGFPAFPTIPRAANGTKNPPMGESPHGRSGIEDQSATNRRSSSHSARSGFPHAMPPGGLIGGTPGLGTGQAGTSNSSRKINPIGGLIGGGGAGTGPAGSAGSRPGQGRSQAGGPYGLSSVGGTSTSPRGITPAQTGWEEQGKDRATPWDRDHPWETAEGVPPVVRPPEDEGPIDPGPAIGLSR